MKKTLIHCSKCSKALNIPNNKHIKFTCPACGKAHEYNNGILIINNQTQSSQPSKDAYGSFIDERNGKEYKTKMVGDIEIMLTPLDCDTYRNGEEVNHVEDRYKWKEYGLLEVDCSCYFNNDPVIGKKMGKFYNWYAVSDKRGLAPKGWRLPTRKEKEWRIIFDEIGKYNSGMCRYDFVFLRSTKAIFWAANGYWGSTDDIIIIDDYWADYFPDEPEEPSTDPLVGAPAFFVRDR